MSLTMPPPATSASYRLYAEFLLNAAKSMTRDSGCLSPLEQFARLLRPLFQLRRKPNSCSRSHSVLSFHNYTLTWLRERIFFLFSELQRDDHALNATDVHLTQPF